jgi:NTP pyrophosphatase (non-canonical NTP hydrolase)
MREKMLLIAERIRRKANGYQSGDPEFVSAEWILKSVAEAIEEELADPLTFYVCASCGARMASDHSYVEPHKPECPQIR